jgi:hypothetical protein
MLAELGHGDAAQSERRRILAQGDPLEGAERVAAASARAAAAIRESMTTDYTGAPYLCSTRGDALRRICLQ